MLPAVDPEMTSVLARKLGLAADLSQSDLDALTGAVEHIREVPARTILIDEGDRPEHVHVVLEGFAYRYKLLGDGGRQIMAWLVPGDFCDLHVALLGRMDHVVSTASPSRVGLMSRNQVERIIDASPALSRALWWASLVQEAILREWLVNLGRRDAESRMAHFFCELHARLGSVSLAKGDAIEFPLTQAELADSLGLSTVHVNRTVQALREQGLVEWSGKKLVLKDVESLRERAGFDPTYLHVERRSVRGIGTRESVVPMPPSPRSAP